ncbi:MAG: hypothetical protein JRJ29_00445 [Deltaproteobacteria bacterium]|nr:hypothetical protein [Deltaproteobacteria bacterium]MBW2081637.1 hypothetical protein [Deltaproteobacteria bacterium]
MTHITHFQVDGDRYQVDFEYSEKKLNTIIYKYVIRPEYSLNQPNINVLLQGGEHGTAQVWIDGGIGIYIPYKNSIIFWIKATRLALKQWHDVYVSQLFDKMQALESLIGDFDNNKVSFSEIKQTVASMYKLIHDID